MQQCLSKYGTSMEMTMYSLSEAERKKKVCAFDCISADVGKVIYLSEHKVHVNARLLSRKLKINYFFKAFRLLKHMVFDGPDVECKDLEMESNGASTPTESVTSQSLPTKVNKFAASENDI